MKKRNAKLIAEIAAIAVGNEPYGDDTCALDKIFSAVAGGTKRAPERGEALAELRPDEKGIDNE